MDQTTYQLAVQLRDRLRQELTQNETFMAYEHANALVAMGERARERETSGPVASAIGQKRVASVASRHYPGSQTSRIVEGARDYLRRKGSRAPSGEICRELASQGIKVAGKSPLKTTASYLSHSPYFDNVPGQGYGLMEWSVSQHSQKTETPDSDELSGTPRSNGALPLNL